MPVLPDVGSISVSPGWMSPRFSASTIIDSAGRSFTEPAGLLPSSLPRTTFVVVAGQPLQADERRVADGDRRAWRSTVARSDCSDAAHRRCIVSDAPRAAFTARSAQSRARLPRSLATAAAAHALRLVVLGDRPAVRARESPRLRIGLRRRASLRPAPSALRRRAPTASSRLDLLEAASRRCP